MDILIAFALTVGLLILHRVFLLNVAPALGLEGHALSLGVEALTLTCVVVYMTWRGPRERYGLMPWSRWSMPPVAWLATLTVLPYLGPLEVPLRGVFPLLLLCLLTALVQEAAVRGVVMDWLRSRGPLVNVLVSSAIYVGAQALMLMYDGATPVGVWQTYGFGVMLAGLRLRTGSLFPCVVLHAATAFAMSALDGWSGVDSAAFRLLYPAAYIACGLWLIREHLGPIVRLWHGEKAGKTVAAR